MPQEPQRPTILQSWKSCCEHCRLQPQVTELCIMLLPVKPQDFALSLLGKVFLRCFQDKKVIVYINHDSINLSNMINASFVWNVQCCSSGSSLMENIRRFHPLSAHHWGFRQSKTRTECFRWWDNARELREKKVTATKSASKNGERFHFMLHVETGLIYDGTGMRRQLFSGANTARAFSKEVIHFDFSQSRAYWGQLILSILRTIDSYWFFISSEKLWNFVNFAFNFCCLSNARSVGECALCRQSLRKEALDEILRVREPGAVHAEETIWMDWIWNICGLTSMRAAWIRKTQTSPSSPGRSGRKDNAWAVLAARSSTWFASCVTLKQRSFEFRSVDSSGSPHNFRTLKIQDPTARAIVFVQWKSLRRKLAEAFTEFEARTRKQRKRKIPPVFHCLSQNVSNVSKFVTSGAICLPRGAVVGCGVGSQVPGKKMDRPW